MPSLRTVGTIGEAKALFKFSEYGINSYVPFNENTRIDLIIDPNNILQRIQIKTSTVYKNGCITFGLEHNGLYDDTQIDYYVLYDLIVDKLYMIHVNDFLVKGKSTVTLRYDPPKNHIKTGINYAEDYDIDIVINRDFKLAKMSIDYIKSIHLKKEKDVNILPTTQLSANPGKDELIKLFNEYGTVTNVSKILGVSRNTVSKWCKKEHINYKIYNMSETFTKTCPYCNKTFMTKKVNQIYCSKDCSIHHYRDKIDITDVLKLYFEENKSFRFIAKKYNVGHMMISNIVNEHLKKNNNLYNLNNL